MQSGMKGNSYFYSFTFNLAMSEIQKNIWFKSGNMILHNAFIFAIPVWKEKMLEPL